MSDGEILFHEAVTDGNANDSSQAASDPAKRCQLPNGMEIAYQSRAEVGFFYHDIFEKEIYLKHGVRLSEGDCVFDVGANVGFFTLFAHQQARGLKIYAFEPAPPLFNILSFNVARHGVNARLFDCGISDHDETVNFTFYPNSSGMSSFYADKQEEQAALRAIMENQLQQGVAGMEQIMHYAADLIEERLKAFTYECRLRTLSSVIREEGVEVIDFLKVDVQKSELDVLRGIEEEDWPKIRQIVIEVHDINDRLGLIRTELEQRGYEVAIEQDDHYQNSILYNLFARRSAGDEVSPGAVASEKLDEASLRQIRERAKRRELALKHRRQSSPRRNGR